MWQLGLNGNDTKSQYILLTDTLLQRQHFDLNSLRTFILILGIISCDFVPLRIPTTTTSSIAYSKRHISDITLRQCSTWGFPLREGRLIQPYSHSLKTSVE